MARDHGWCGDKFLPIPEQMVTTPPPFFSVIIPTYNREMLIQESVQSVLDQSFEHFELLVIDNGSTDNTKSIVKGMSDRRVKYRYQEGTGSPAGPRNTGLELARGDWIAFLDSDDLWETEKLAECWQAIQVNSPDLVTHVQRVNSFDGKPLGLMYPTFSVRSPYRFLLTHENTFATSATLVRRQFLDKESLRFSEEEELATVEDFDLWLRIAAAGGKLCVIHKTLGRNRIHSGNTGSVEGFLDRLQYLYQEHASSVQQFEPNRSRLIRRLHSRLFLMRSYTSLRKQKYIDFIKLQVEAFGVDIVEPFRYFAYRVRQRVSALFRPVWRKHYTVSNC